jgi:trans-feruloyl-CoA hydratase/vanillin synthase
MARKKNPWGKLVLVEFDDGIAWVTLNRPDKRNAMSPKLNVEMRDTVEALARTRVDRRGATRCG